MPTRSPHRIALLTPAELQAEGRTLCFLYFFASSFPIWRTLSLSYQLPLNPLWGSTGKCPAVLDEAAAGEEMSTDDAMRT